MEYNLKDFEKEYAEKNFALKVYNEIVNLSQQERKNIRYKVKIKNVVYEVCCSIPKDYKISMFIGEHLVYKKLIQHKIISKYNIFNMCGKLCFYEKMGLSLITNVKIYFGKLTMINDNEMVVLDSNHYKVVKK